MNRWEFFESGAGLTAVRIGVVSIDLLTKYDLYKTYRELLLLNTPAKARVLAADACKCHYASIVRAIYWFEKDDPGFTFTFIPRGTRSNRKFSNS